MARCRYCFDPRRNQIDQLYVDGAGYRAIIRAFGGSLGAASRHAQHVRDLIKERGPVETAEHGADLLNRCESLFTQTEEILATCKTDKNFRGAVAAVGALTRVLELLAKLRGELSPSGGVHLNFTSNKLTINQNAGSDEELAVLVAEATLNFNAGEIQRLRSLAEASGAFGNLGNDRPQPTETTKPQ